MSHVAQFDTGGFREFGVLSQYLDREGNLVDYALTRTVPAVEKFKVLNSIVLSIAVDVVNRFFGKQFAPNVLSHNETMFENVPWRFAVFPRYAKSNVTVADFSPRNFLFRVVSLVAKPAESRTTFGAAKTTLAVYRPARPSLNGHFFPALYASYLPFRFGQLVAFPRTFTRTVFGVFAVLFSVCTRISGAHRKSLSALLAREMFRLFARGNSTVFTFVERYARLVTKFSRCVFRLYEENLRAIQTLLTDRHNDSVCFVGGVIK